MSIVSRHPGLYHVMFAIAVATSGVVPAFLTGALSIQIRDELGFDEVALGLALALFFTSSALCSVVSGRIVERIGARAGMRLATMSSAAALMGVAVFARSWWQLVAALCFAGFANSVSHPATHLLLARRVAAARQGFAFGIKQSAIPTATLLAGLSVPLFTLTLGWRWAFVAAAVATLIVCWRIPGVGEERAAPPTSPGATNPAAGASAGASTDNSRHTRALVVLALGLGLGSAAAVPLGTFTVEWGVSSGIPVEFAGLLLALGSVTGILVRVSVGWLADRRERGHLRIVSLMLAVGTLGFALISTGVPALLVVGVILAFGLGWGWTGLFNFAVVKSSPTAPAAATGITQTGASAGSAVGPLLFGLMVAGTSYSAAWLGAAALALIAAGAILVGRRMLLQGLDFEAAQDPAPPVEVRTHP